MHLPRYLSRKYLVRKGQSLIEFMIVFPVIFLMISAFHLFYMDMIYRQTAQANMWFIMRATTIDPYVQEYRAEDCADAIKDAFPGVTWITTAASWSQSPDDTLRIFNWLQPFDPCYMEDVALDVYYFNPLSEYLPLGFITTHGTMWTSWANRHPSDYKIVMQTILYGMLPLSVWVEGVMIMLGSLPDQIAEILSGR